MKAEQFIKDYTRSCSNELVAVEDKNGKKVISYYEWLTPEQALAAVEIAREELIDKAIEWLDKNARLYVLHRRVNGYNMSGMDARMTVNFRKAMEN